MTTGMDTPATAPQVRTDDLLEESPQPAPGRPQAGPDPERSDAERAALAVLQAPAGFASGARRLRHAHDRRRHLFPCLPQQSGHHRRLRAAASLIRHCIRVLAADTAAWTDDVWIGKGSVAVTGIPPRRQVLLGYGY
jgi:hypothetical protein